MRCVQFEGCPRLPRPGPGPRGLGAWMPPHGDLWKLRRGLGESGAVLGWGEMFSRLLPAERQLPALRWEWGSLHRLQGVTEDTGPCRAVSSSPPTTQAAPLRLPVGSQLC